MRETDETDDKPQKLRKCLFTEVPPWPRMLSIIVSSAENHYLTMLITYEWHPRKSQMSVWQYMYFM